MMKKSKVCTLTKAEKEFMEIIWKLEPINSTQLVHECEKQFEWKKSTTYTVLKNLCRKDIIRNEGAIVTSTLKREEYYGAYGRAYVEEYFNGSLPLFLTAFCGNSVKLSEKDKEEIRKLIEEC